MREIKNENGKSRIPKVLLKAGSSQVANIEDIVDPAKEGLRGIVAELLSLIGEDTSREGLLETPRRVEQSLTFCTKGYKQNLDKLVNGALFDTDYDELVLVKDIDFYSLCEHHLLPFFGKCHVAYYPSKKIIGLSKLPKIVEMYSRRLQVQERLTSEIAEAIQKKIEPRGLAVVVEARHLCMMMRGVEKQNAVAVTSSMLGIFRESQTNRTELLDLIRTNRLQ